MFATPNFGPSDKEGGNGLDYVSSGDPRIKVNATKTRPGQDGTPIWVTTDVSRGNSPVPLATGIEARLIEAEALLKSSDAAGWLAKLNAARASRLGRELDAAHGSGYGRRARGPTVPGARVLDVLHVAPHRRPAPTRQAIRPCAETVWPTGNYFKGGVYGADQNLPPSQAEKNNPGYTGCTDRAA